MRIAQLGRLSLLAAATVTLLSACVPTDEPPAATASADPTPVFASDDEALAAAVAVYERYAAVAADIAESDWLGGDRFSEVASGSLLEQELEFAENARNLGYVATGELIRRDYVIQRVSQAAGLPIEVVFYVCVDWSAYDLKDSTGKSLLDRTGENSALYEVEVAGYDLESLRVSRSGPWDADSSC